MAAARKNRSGADVHDLLDQLAGEEQMFLERQFLAPTTGGPTVRAAHGRSDLHNAR